LITIEILRLKLIDRDLFNSLIYNDRNHLKEYIQKELNTLDKKHWFKKIVKVINLKILIISEINKAETLRIAQKATIAKEIKLARWASLILIGNCL
jgi:hypothetical protein